MEDYSQYLLSQKKRRDLHYHNRLCNETLEKLSGEWELISKYHERIWFQRLFKMNKEELLIRYRELAYHLTWAENDIPNNKYLLHMHNVAVEELHKDMTPFNKPGLSNHPVTQQQLFNTLK